MFTPQEIAARLMRIERARNAGDAAVQDEDDPVPERPGLDGGTCSAVQIKDLLTAAVLGTS